MQLRQFNVGCFGGGTGLPSGLQAHPWLSLNAVVTPFASGSRSGRLREELGVLPSGDERPPALARNAQNARRAVLSERLL